MSESLLVPRWQPRDFTFVSDAEHGNPFGVEFRALVQTPSTGGYTVDGFHDGDGVWKIRFAPWEEGAWSLTTRSTDPALDGREVTFVCVANSDPAIHGGLQVDRDNPRHFVWEDGSRYFLLGYECDWLWALDLTPDGTAKGGIPTVERLLDRLAANGFNHLLLNAYAHDCGWQEGCTGPDDYGPPPMYAWEGTNEEPDHSRFNLSYWQHYDRVIGAMASRGIVAHLMIKVYNKMVNWPAPGSADDDRFFRWMIARYAAFPNIVWDFSKESNNEPNLDYKLDRMRFIRQYDVFRRLITTHDDEAVYESGAYDRVLDFHSDQHHEDWHAETLRKRSLNEWPVVNIELGYEQGPGGPEDRTYGVVQPAEEVCRRAWEVCMAGGYATYYYTYTAWDVIRPDDEPPGYAYFSYLRRFFEDTGFERLEPADHLVRLAETAAETVNAAYCLADAGSEYVVYIDRSAAFELAIESECELRARWYDPLTGEWTDGETIRGGTMLFHVPDVLAGKPVALHLTA